MDGSKELWIRLKMTKLPFTWNVKSLQYMQRGAFFHQPMLQKARLLSILLGDAYMHWMGVIEVMRVSTGPARPKWCWWFLNCSNSSNIFSKYTTLSWKTIRRKPKAWDGYCSIHHCRRTFLKHESSECSTLFNNFIVHEPLITWSGFYMYHLKPAANSYYAKLGNWNFHFRCNFV